MISAIRRLQFAYFRCLLKAHQTQLFGNSCVSKMTALHFAACHNAVHVVQILLDECATDINESTGGCLGFPIAFAAYFGHEATVEVLLERANQVAQPQLQLMTSHEDSLREVLLKNDWSFQAVVRGYYAAAVKDRRKIVQTFLGKNELWNKYGMTKEQTDELRFTAQNIAERAGYHETAALLEPRQKSEDSRVVELQSRYKPINDMIEITAAAANDRPDIVASLLRGQSTHDR